MTGAEIAAGAAVAAATVAAAGAIQQGRHASAMAKYQAELAERDARIARDVAAARVEDLRRRGEVLSGRQRAYAAANGVVVDTGSPLEIVAETARDVELDALRVQWAGDAEAANALADAAIARMEGKAAKTAATFSAAGSLLRAVGASGPLWSSGGDTSMFPEGAAYPW